MSKVFLSAFGFLVLLYAPIVFGDMDTPPQRASMAAMARAAGEACA